MTSPARLTIDNSGSVRWITVNRPEKHNAFAPGLVDEFHSALDDAASDPVTKAVIITGAGSKAFVAGNDVTSLSEMTSIEAYKDMRGGQRLMLRLHQFPKPTIAMVNGYALGGGFELALACDLIVASTTAKFGFPEITLNTMPGWGGTQFAVQKLGISRAKEMVLTGRHYLAEECYGFGFIASLAEPDRLRSVTLALAESICRHEAFALEVAKMTLNRAADVPLGAGLDLEAAAYALNFGTAHAAAGFRRFLER